MPCLKSFAQNSAAIVYDLIAAEWDDSVCGGGGKCLVSYAADRR